MGKKESEMIKVKHRPATKYVSYVSPMQGHVVYNNGFFQIFLDVKRVPGTLSSIFGKGNHNILHNMKVTIECEDY
ncbi:MAG: hypothetical protein QXU18_13390 [Thermoplasmatales archaeon]